ncbi:MAG: VWA domain-containing protein [Bacteroidetes bacterium]|nr:VWA domain-containing protein [Bacteroidota bacterium]
MIDWWDSLIFADKWALWFLLAVPVLAVAVFLLAGKGKPVLRLSSFRYLQGAPSPPIVKWRTLLYILRLGAIVLLIMAFARPQSKSEFKRSHGEGIDIMLAIDVSPSMNAIDISPTRMIAAKTQAERFIDARPDDRIGVVIFSAETFTLCPLTSDHEALKTMIETMDPATLEMGTAIGMGLAKCVERLKDSKAKSKVIILLTDGENNAGIIAPLDAGKLAKTYNIRVYTIGLGANSGKVLAPVTQNPDGTFVQQYQDVDIDEATLMNIAKNTGGKYFRAGDSGKLEEIYNEINRMEKSEFEKNDNEQRQEEFLPFVNIAILLLFVEFILRYTLFDSIT